MERENEEEDVSIYPKENRIYWNLKSEALNYTLWRIHCAMSEGHSLVSGAQWRCGKYRGGKMQDGTSLSAADGVQPGCHLAHLLI